MEANKKETTFQVAGDWSVQLKQLKQKFPLLTNVDLKFEKGKEEDLIERLVIKLNKKRPEVIELLRQIQMYKS